MDIVKKIIPAVEAKEKITYVAKDGKPFDSEKLCTKYERLLAITEKIPNFEEWFYISSEEEYNAFFELIEIKYRELIEWADFDPKYHLGWISFEYSSNQNGISHCFVTSAREIQEILAELEKIKPIQ